MVGLGRLISTYHERKPNNLFLATFQQERLSIDLHRDCKSKDTKRERERVGGRETEGEKREVGSRRQEREGEMGKNGGGSMRNKGKRRRERMREKERPTWSSR